VTIVVRGLLGPELLVTGGLLPSGGPPPSTSALWSRFNSARFNGRYFIFAAPAPLLNLKEAIVATLSAHAPTIALVGQSLYPMVVPQSHTPGDPALTYRIISSLHDTNIAKASGMRSTRVRFRISSAVQGDVEACLEVLRQLFQGLIGPLSGLPICFVTLENEVDDYDEPIPGSDLGTHYKEFDFVFKFRESIPTNT
jgi:hypothetical protein